MHHNQDIPLPPQEMQDLIGGFFYTASDEMFETLVKEGRLHSGSKVLDLGCGCGRIASPLTKVLRDGEYDGIDIVLPMIEWCRNNITPTYTNFCFHHADLKNTHYSSEGRDAASYVFPSSDAQYDLVFAASLFTHLVPASAEQYLKETARVLKPNGLGILTFYISTPETDVGGKQVGKVHFNHRVTNEYSVAERDNPEGVIAFDEPYLLSLIRDSGLAVCNVSYGRWSRHPTAWSYQDVVLVRRL